MIHAIGEIPLLRPTHPRFTPSPSTLVLVSIYSTNIPYLFLSTYYDTIPYEEMLCLADIYVLHTSVASVIQF